MRNFESLQIKLVVTVLKSKAFVFDVFEEKLPIFCVSLFNKF